MQPEETKIAAPDADPCYCLECGWIGEELALVPDINETFSVCPICKSQSIVFL